MSERRENERAWWLVDEQNRTVTSAHPLGAEAACAGCDDHRAAGSWPTLRDRIRDLELELQALQDVECAARRVEAFLSDEGPPFRFTGLEHGSRRLGVEAEVALLDLHDCLTALDLRREIARAPMFSAELPETEC